MDRERPKRIQSVLFVCAYNAVRSPMAEHIARHYFGKSVYVQSAGVHRGDRSDFMVGALDEIGIDASKHKPRTLDELEEWEGLNFDLIVSLSPDAHHAALELTRTIAAEVEYWPTRRSDARPGLSRPTARGVSRPPRRAFGQDQAEAESLIRGQARKSA